METQKGRLQEGGVYYYINIYGDIGNKIRRSYDNRHWNDMKRYGIHNYFPIRSHALMVCKKFEEFLDKETYTGDHRNKLPKVQIGESYYYLDTLGRVNKEGVDYGYFEKINANHNYEINNYFYTLKQANRIHRKFRKLLKGKEETK